MKFMMMTFGTAEEMVETASPDWIRDMIRFMRQLNTDLTANGELLDAQGLVDGTQAKTTRMVDGVAAVTDGPFAEAKESLVGYWLLDVASEERAHEIALSITNEIGAPIEVRRVADGPPEV